MANGVKRVVTEEERVKRKAEKAREGKDRNSDVS